MATEKDKCREAIRRTLADHAGAAPDANTVAAATVRIWQQVSDRLVPVIGVRGVDVLLRRTLHLMHKAFPWIAIPGGEDKENAALLISLHIRLTGNESEVAAEAGYTLLVTFTELLSTLIGESLTERLLEPVWMSTPPSAAKETLS